MDSSFEMQLSFAETAIRTSAHDLFDSLDPAFGVNVYLVAIPLSGAPEPKPIIIPKENPFDAVKLQVALAEWGRDETAETIDMLVRADFPFTLRSSYGGNNQELFVGEGVGAVKSHYSVFPVVELSSTTVDAHDVLLKVEGDPTSFLRTVVKVFLDEAGRVTARYLNDPLAIARFIPVSKEGVLRRAGEAFTYAVARITQEAKLTADGERDLSKSQILSMVNIFPSLNAISHMSYEGETGEGHILLAKTDHPDVKVHLKLSSPISLDEHRSIRKLLEITDENLSLLWDQGHVYGLGERNGSKFRDVFAIEMVSHYSWNLLDDGRELMAVAYEKPSLPSDEPPLPPEKLISALQQVFSTLATPAQNSLCKLVDAATKQDHGTMVVISDHAAEEAERLAELSTQVEPVKLTPRLMEHATSIDGAVLIDQHSTCYSLGVILDGISEKTEGDASRGARYNSAVRYRALAKREDHQCVIVVVSEDGMVDLLTT